ncbi:radical SAM protein [Deltaproteobacteria bacterium]|nr:radical SAM protein [Deltaproteobacteria bacterium]
MSHFCMPPLIFPAPEPARLPLRIQPAFIPFQGCPARCIFCAQTLQTGQGIVPVRVVLDRLKGELDQAKERLEIAFYGGTFTLLPLAEQKECLALAAVYKTKGIVTGVRASTRPDAIDSSRLAALREAGLDMLELGVQSFDNSSLAASKRGYDADAAAQGCALVKASGLALGIQLMPGMPGMAGDAFRRDMEKALSFSPDALRLYPCLVLADTPLAELYAQGAFTPWTLEKIAPLLAGAQEQAWEAGIRIIRIGLAPQAELASGGIMAGPYHPALGSLVRGLALFAYIAGKMETARPLQKLSVPKRFQGEFWGHRGSLKDAYGKRGLTKENVVWSDEDHFTAWQG